MLNSAVLGSEGPSRKSRLAGLFLLSSSVAASAFASGESVPTNAVDIPAGATVTITFQVDVDSPLGTCADAVVNQGTLSGSNFPGTLTDDPDVVGSDNPTVTGLDVVDLAVTKSNGTVTSVPGAMTTYTIVVSNSGPSPAVGASIVDTFPASLTGVTWTCVAAGAGSACNAAGIGNISEAINVGVGGSVTFTATGTIDPAATGSLVNTATAAVGATQTECNTTNNSQTDTDTLDPQATVTITKDDGVTEIDAGEATTYTITVTNAAGPSDMAGVTVADSFPAELLNVSYTCILAGGATVASGCDGAAQAGDISDTVDLPAGASVVYTATGTVDPSTASATLSNTASVTNPIGADDSDTDVDTINRVADLAITKTDGVTSAVPGFSVTYTLVASNSAGPSDVVGATVTDTFPAVLSCDWTCVPTGVGASCSAGPVAGDISDLVDLPVGTSVTYTAVCLIADDASGTLVNTATVAPPAGTSDPNGANDSDTDDDTVLRQLDFGDAPDGAPALPVQGGPTTYPTLLVSDGARHGIVPGFNLGVTIDAEGDGQPNPDATGDDLAGTDDEDGVVFTADLVTCEQASLAVVATAAGALDAWVDFDGDGDWGDAGEQIFKSQALAAGNNDLVFTVPCTALDSDEIFARFRFSSTGGLAEDGVAADGEVEDYRVEILGLDFGDAPDPTFLTLFANDGARHAQPNPNPVILGALVDSEVDGQPDANATGDDLAGIDDEDGILFPAAVIPGQSIPVDVTASGSGLLNAWMDFNGNGFWADAGEQIFTDEPVVAGVNNLFFNVPGEAVVGITFARFRVSTAGDDGFESLAADGEVEDYSLEIFPAVDLAITKDDDADPPAPGNDLVYTLTVTNNGPGDASGVVVTDTLPAAVSYVSDDCGASDVPPWTWNVGNLADGASVVCNISVSINPTPPSSLSNTATVAGNEFDPNLTNNSDTEETTLDAAAPEVVLLDSSPSTEDGEITQCETAQLSIASFEITFSEAVQDNGPLDTDSVTHPANYRLVRPATAGADFDTTTCVGGTGADQVIAIDSVAYDDGTFTAVLSLNGGSPLEPSLYRLLVCGTTSILDLAGNALDGGDGPGTDFVRTFRTDPGNLFDDGHFDNHSPECSLGAWMSSDLGQVEIADLDADGSPLSGSAHNADPLNGFDLAQCLNLAGEQQFPLSAQVRVEAAGGQAVSISLVCDFLNAPSCGGSAIGQAVVPGAFLDTGGGFQSLAGDGLSPAGTLSALCGFAVLPPAEGAYDAYLDLVFLGGNPLIFADGFETGDTSLWTVTVP